MVKKIVGIILFVFLITQCSFAQTIAVKALQDFSTENPTETLSIMPLESLYSDDELLFLGGDILEGKIEKVKSPKRLKRNANFTFIPVARIDQHGVKSNVEWDCSAKYTTVFNKADLAKHAALGVGNYFVKGLSMGYSAIEGAVKNEKDNRFKSSVTAVYEDSPISYVEKGKDIVIKKDQIFLLKFKTKNEEESQHEQSVETPEN